MTFFQINANRIVCLKVLHMGKQNTTFKYISHHNTEPKKCTDGALTCYNKN